MSRWRRLSRNRRASYLAMAVFVLATTGWAASSGLVPAWDEVFANQNLQAEDVFPTAQEEPADLAEPLPGKPEEVFIQRTSAFGDKGNVLVTVRLTADQIAARREEGAPDFITVGDLNHQVILRDDGVGGDAVAGDAVFTGVGTVDEADLSERATADSDTFNSTSTKESPVFDGRAVVGTETPVPFDFAAFQAGRNVRLDPAVAFIEPETPTSSSGTTPTTDAVSVATSRGLTPTTEAAFVPGTNVFQERVLIIRHVGVVTDPARTFNPCNNGGNPHGVWTFKHIMTEMANPAASGIDPALFAESWLNHWLANQLINNDNVGLRNQINTIISQWKTESGGVKLDLTRSPLRLLAILPRVDQRRTTGGGSPYAGAANGKFLDAGELRFVFGFVLKPGWTAGSLIGPVQIPGQAAGCRALPFSVIVELKVPKCECKGVRDWARRWVDLRNHTPGTVPYNSRLQSLTQEIVRANANPARPNGSNLGQLRTNEVALAAPWELREFQLTQFPFTLLRETTVADTPQDVWNNTILLRDWILGFAGQPIPLFFQGNNFLGGNSIVPDPPGVPTHHWNAPGLNLADPVQNNKRFIVSLNACNGCHRGETGTHFVHIDPSINIPGSTGGLPVAISGFMTGISWNDPAHGSPTREFDDLARREKDIKQVAKMACFRFHPVNVAHVQATLRSTGSLPADLFFGLSTLPFEQRVPVGVDDFRRNRITSVH
ncbi:MAG TPA: hypothetical protein VE685_16090 [Thermoanaerobaculia bacterium]|nr:hypothetical protein [Thermoanaerobaculia bacterium]